MNMGTENGGVEGYMDTCLWSWEQGRAEKGLNLAALE
jgi:hypothetical protein